MTENPNSKPPSDTGPTQVPAQRPISHAVTVAPASTHPAMSELPWVTLLLLSFVMPIHVLRSGWYRQGLLSAWAVHIIGLGVAAISLVLIDLTYSDSYFLYAVGGYGTYGMSNFLYEAIGLFLFVELMYVFGALCFMGWAARCEPWRASFVRSLKRWYQLTPWHVAASLFTLIIFTGFDEFRLSFYDRHDPSSSTYYGSGLSPEMEAITYLCQASLGLAYFGLVGWRTLVALGVHRPEPGWPASCAWPAHCEGCGYSLAGLEDNRDCPECGRPVSESKYTTRQPRPMAPLRAMWAAVAAPRELGRQLTIHHAAYGHGWCYFFTLCCFAAIGQVAVVFTMLSMVVTGEVELRDLDFESFLFILFGGLIAAIYAMSLAILLIQGTGFLVGLGQRLFGRRYRVHTANQAACYSSGVLVPFGVFASIASAIWFNAMILSFASMWGGPPHPVAEILVAAIPLLLLVFGLGVFVYYLMLINRIVAGAKYANA